MAEAEGLLLAHVGDRDDLGDLAHLLEQAVLALLLEHVLELEGRVEVVLDRVLAAARDDDDPLDAGVPRLLDDVLDQWPVDQGQHLLGLGLRGGQEPGSQAGGREDGDADLGHASSLADAAPAEPLQYEGERGQRTRAPGGRPGRSRPRLFCAAAPAHGAASWWRLPVWGAEVRAFALDPFEPGVVYCGTSRGNFYVSQRRRRDLGGAEGRSRVPGLLRDVPRRRSVRRAGRLWASLAGELGGGLVVAQRRPRRDVDDAR